MNEKDLEQRLRSVTEGPQPSAPLTLRRFLHGLPETQAARHAGPIGWLRRIGGGIGGSARGIFGPVPLARRAQMAVGLSIALVVGLVATQLLMSVRQAQVASSNSDLDTAPPTLRPTPDRSHTSAPSPIVVMPSPDVGISWIGVPQTGYENQAMPTSVAIWPLGGYMGVSVEPYGQNGLVYSTDGLYWDWRPASDVAPDVALTSIAADGIGRVVVGGATQGIDGTMDGRIYYSDDGGPWLPVPDQSVFGGTPVQVVVRGAAGWLALGWNAATPAGAVRPVMAWYSADGLTWQRPSEPLPVKGTWAYVAATAYGFVLSGTPLTSGAPSQPPIWFSRDGRTWTRSTSAGNSAQKLESLFSVAVSRNGLMVGVCSVAGETGMVLLMSLDYGADWSPVNAGDDNVNPKTFVAIAAMGMSDGPFFAASEKDGRIYVSTDGGQHWLPVVGEGGVRPLGTMLVSLGDLTQAEEVKILSFGCPECSAPIWLAQTGR